MLHKKNINAKHHGSFFVLIRNITNPELDPETASSGSVYESPGLLVAILKNDPGISSGIAVNHI